MSGITDLGVLLRSLSPTLAADEYVFCTSEETGIDFQQLNPVATVRENEGTTLVVSRQAADKHQLCYSQIFRQITLNVHSDLGAVGLTAAVATQLASRGISANVIAGFYHDHIFVPDSRADEALSALEELVG